MLRSKVKVIGSTVPNSFVQPRPQGHSPRLWRWGREKSPGHEVEFCTQRDLRDNENTPDVVNR